MHTIPGRRVIMILFLTFLLARQHELQDQHGNRHDHDVVAE
jgi:hypothetical protein